MQSAAVAKPAWRPIVKRLVARGFTSWYDPLLAAVAFLIRLIPRRWAFAWARTFWRLERSTKKNLILRHRDAALGTQAGAAVGRSNFWENHLTHLARTIVEPFRLSRMPDAEVIRRVGIDGEQHLRAAVDTGRGAILFLSHLGNAAALIRGLAVRGYDLTVVGHRLRHDYAETLVSRLFRRGRAERVLLGPELPWRAANVLARNGCFAMFIDFPLVQKHNRHVPFGAASMKVNLGPALLALRHAAPVLCINCVRTGDNRHHIFVDAPLVRPVTENRSDAAALMIENALRSVLSRLRENPDQWWQWDSAEIAPRRRDCGS